MKPIKAIPTLVLCAMFSWSAQAAPINEVSYASLTGNVLVDFESLTGGSVPGTNYDSIIDLYGVSFGERFNGQTLTFSGDSDILGGSPTGSLSLVAGDPNDNLNILSHSIGGNVISGLGHAGYPDYSAIGEGAIAMLFDKDQSEFGFQSVGGNVGTAYFDFFARDGSLIASIMPTDLGTDWFGFSREGGIKDIAGISIYNTDFAGIGFNDIIFDVRGDDDPRNNIPEPGTALLLALGLAGIGYRRHKTS